MGINVQGSVDVDGLVARINHELKTSGLANICIGLLGVDLPKSKDVIMSNWEKVLTDEQIRYAALDAVAGLLIYEEATR